MISISHLVRLLMYMSQKFSKSKAITRLTIFVLFIAIIFNGWSKIDPDFGWHLTTGKLISSSGIPQTDPFSYTMTSFPFVDHEWLTNLIIYWLYTTLGYGGLAVLFASLFLASIFVLDKKMIVGNINRQGFFSPKNSLLMLAIGIMIPYSGIRPQVQTWFWLSILMWLIKSFETGKRLKYFLPLLFLIWSNLHGGFSIGIATLFTYLAFRSFRLRKIIFEEVIIFFLSLLGTLINPYGYKLWGEVWMQLSDHSLRWRIAEWTPSFLNFDLPYIFYVALACFLVIKYRRKFYLEELVIFAGFFVEAVLSLRHVPLWVIISVPMVAKTCDWLYQDIEKIVYGKERFRKVMIILFLVSLGLLFFQTLFTLRSPLSEDSYYPKKAALYLKDNLPKGEIFSNYGWGGYLIWKLPEKKVFIDGRMPSWRWQGVPKESKYAMEDYLKVVTEETASKKILEAYGVDTVLWYKSKTKPNNKSFFEKKIREFFKQKEEKSFLEGLIADKWKVTYEDSLSTILQKE